MQDELLKDLQKQAREQSLLTKNQLLPKKMPRTVLFVLEFIIDFPWQSLIVISFLSAWLTTWIKSLI